MRKAWWLRPLAVFTAFWLPLTLGEPGVLHVCEAHGGLPHAMTPSPHGHAHAAAGTHAAEHESGKPGHDHAGCTCLGACSPSGFAAELPSAILDVSFQGVRTSSSAPARDTWRRPGNTPRRLLPFANGPPAGITAA